jgi:pimeloyl-ACP methyl ester carboxylesterase
MNRCVMMTHGMWANPWCWTGYRAMFEADGRRCLVPPLPCHDSDMHAAPDSRLGRLSLLDCADTLAAQITALGERAIVIGHSMGGLLAQMLGARGLARTAVLLAPAAPAAPAGVWAIGPSVLRSFWKILTTWAFWRKPVRQTFAAASYSLLHRLPPDEQREVYGRFGPESGRVVFEIGLWLPGARHAARVDAAKVDCPMLVVGGSEDRMTPPCAMRRVARRYPATHREHEHHAHWLVGEPGWQDIAGEVLAWMNAQVPA